MEFGLTKFVECYKKLKAFWKLVSVKQKRNACPQEHNLIGKRERQRWSGFSHTLWYFVTFSCLSQNVRMVWVGRDFKDHLVPTPLLICLIVLAHLPKSKARQTKQQSALQSTREGCSEGGF